ncbi:TonB-dependent receptor [Cellulophaga sp. F20128]|uniref:TonB-dependent receptor n=1 Tax=Cellulophaga sp. F20128 TaxID=2926413 RepID=UPI001FF6DC17|nr:TonB-dependent receptor [Cellulophaga sp. F20128]MCK0157437.1 TonB-dependent receptor [Cellulophaga sp. F20128]
MRLFLSILTLFTAIQYSVGQETYVLKGRVLSNQLQTEINNASVQIEGTLNYQKISNGTFYLTTKYSGEHILQIAAPNYITKRIPLTIDKEIMDLGNIYLEEDITIEQTDNLIALTDNDLSTDESTTITSGLLQATKDVFLNRAAFDFGQAFFRVRGYDSQYGQVLINGILMNQLSDGRPQWNNWGGLNDVTKNQDFTHGLQPLDYGFGGILGTTNIDTRPSLMRSGTRISTSASNRTYAGRLMVTQTVPTNKKGFSYSISASRRWAKEGYINGTLYDAFSVFGAVEYQFNPKNSLTLTAILASNRRGRSSAITEEVFELMGRTYNPYWGTQNNVIRNSREREIEQPIVMINHSYESKALRINTGILYQFGPHSKSRMGYFNSPNPDPTYYRYLPSYHINSPIGANFESAETAKKAFLNNPQLNWNNAYLANASISNNDAVYVLYNDVTDDKILTVNSTANIVLNDKFALDFGLMVKTLNASNYAKIDDLLGAAFHRDVDPFSNTINDIEGNLQKARNDIFNYNYDLYASTLTTFSQFKARYNKWNASITTSLCNTNYQRNGLFKNERYLETSKGESDKIHFSNMNIKGTFTYKLTGRHWFNSQFALINKAPVLQNVFINPRENNATVPAIKSTEIITTDVNYYLRMPKLTGRISAFYTEFNAMTDINFFFVESGVGSDFVQEVVTDINKLHKGLEIGLEYQLSSTVKASAVAALSRYTYNNNPTVAINFDTAGATEDIINLEGTVNLGKADITDYKLAQGPQKALALGLEYRDPKYWWVATSANFLGNNYANISTITRTASFYLDPETGQNFPDATNENVNNLLAQKKMEDFYLLNLVGGKSWLINHKYISIFASINNVFDTVYKTGGYEQSRNGNYGQLAQDNLSGTPSFGTKYWYGYGRTYFLNIAVSF